MKKIGIVTSGGDCGGLNAVIKGAALAAISRKSLCYVIPNGYAGLYNLENFNSLVELNLERLVSLEAGIAGSEAGHSRVKIKNINDPEKYNKIKTGMKKFGLDGLVISGGDDTGSVIVDLTEQGIKCVHAPKTMDLDLMTYSVGGDSTVSRIATIVRDLKTTGRTHNRIVVVEVFGRYAGHTAFRGGVAAETDAILIPEIAADFDIIYEHMKEKFFARLRSSDVTAGTYSIIVAEGLKDANGSEIFDETSKADSFGHKKLAGAGKYVCQQLTKRLKADSEVKELMNEAGLFVEGLYETPEIRSVVPGHLVRSGQTSAFDVNFGIEAGAAATNLLMDGQVGVTVASVDGKTVKYMKTVDAIKQRFVDLDLVTFHEQLGITFGREVKKCKLKYECLTEMPVRHL